MPSILACSEDIWVSDVFQTEVGTRDHVTDAVTTGADGKWLRVIE